MIQAIGLLRTSSRRRAAARRGRSLHLSPRSDSERSVTIDGSGPRRWRSMLPSLQAAGHFRHGDLNNLRLTVGLADLRLFDRAGRELGIFLVPNPPDQPTWKSASILTIAPVDTPTEKSSGFEADFGEMIAIDRFRVDGLPPPYLKRIRTRGERRPGALDAASCRRNGL